MERGNKSQLRMKKKKKGKEGRGKNKRKTIHLAYNSSGFAGMQENAIFSALSIVSATFGAPAEY